MIIKTIVFSVKFKLRFAYTLLIIVKRKNSYRFLRIAITIIFIDVMGRENDCDTFRRVFQREKRRKVYVSKRIIIALLRPTKR